MKSEMQNKYWSSLEELEAQEEFSKKNADEFPAELPVNSDAAETDTAWTRRDFLKLMGFSSAAVFASCSRVPVQTAIPYLVQPENIIAGKAYWYASTCAGCTANCGVLVKNRDGRPIKIEGNPESPIGSGGLCATGQASVLELYDSGRLNAPRAADKAASWAEVDSIVSQGLAAAQQTGGSVRVLTGTVTSPSTKKIITDFCAKYSNTTHVIYDAVSCSALIEAHDGLFAKKVVPHFRFDLAKTIVSIGADFLGTWISPVEFAKQYGKARRVDKTNANMSQHIQFESALSLTGSNADIRVGIKPSEMGLVALKLLSHVMGQEVPGMASGKNDAAIKDVAERLIKNRGKSLVVCGVNDVDVQKAVAKLNHVLDNYGTTLDLDYPSMQKQGVDSQMQKLVEEMESGTVSVLIVAGVNPVYDYAQADRFTKAMTNVKLSVALSMYHDETAKLTQVVAPVPHALESWGDAEPQAGVYQIMQPVLRPVYDTRSVADSLLTWMAVPTRYEDSLKAYWQQNIFSLQTRHLTFDSFWRQCVHDGVYLAAHGPSVNPKIVDDAGFIAGILTRHRDTQGSKFEVSVYESVALREGRGSNNPWLQELPDPISKITWDNYLNVAVDDAKNLALKQGDVVLLEVGGQSLKLPVCVQPGQTNGTLSVALGYGRSSAGKVGTGVGVNAFGLAMMTGASRSYFAVGATLSATGSQHKLALTQTHYSMENRPIVREATTEAYNIDHGAGNKKDPELVMLWQQHENKNHSWGMAIDLNACIGCSGCLVGCQSENNVPVVGKEEVYNRREMHWIRIDRYFKGDVENPEVVFQPMMCQHCANAPCESVCPVLATVHSTDGLNQQVYNRCVGTRYCANNCPYKVRRFNWFDYAGNKKFDYYMNDNTGRMVLNPDVVVRSRGVMEKCSMCVQRIQDANNTARKEGRELDSDKIKMACQQSCPTDAIVFGDLNNPESSISKLLENNKRRYHVLGELNVKPAVNYLTKLREK